MAAKGNKARFLSALFCLGEGMVPPMALEKICTEKEVTIDADLSNVSLVGFRSLSKMHRFVVLYHTTCLDMDVRSVFDKMRFLQRPMFSNSKQTTAKLHKTNGMTIR